MKISIPKEIYPGETRIPLIPEGIQRLVSKGAEVQVESGLGKTLGIPDKTFKDAGAKIIKDRKSLLASADIVLRLRKPDTKEIGNHSICTGNK